MSGIEGSKKLKVVEQWCDEPLYGYAVLVGDQHYWGIVFRVANALRDWVKPRKVLLRIHFRHPLLPLFFRLKCPDGPKGTDRASS